MAANGGQIKYLQFTIVQYEVFPPAGGHKHLGERFQVKRITVNPGSKLSLQKHFHRAEHWVVVNGTALVICW